MAENKVVSVVIVVSVILAFTCVSRALVLRMAHRKWKDPKQQPGTAGPGNMLGCCLISFHFLWAIHPNPPYILS